VNRRAEGFREAAGARSALSAASFRSGIDDSEADIDN
jgi:hypothetical protein